MRLSKIVSSVVVGALAFFAAAPAIASGPQQMVFNEGNLPTTNVSPVVVSPNYTDIRMIFSVDLGSSMTNTADTSITPASAFEFRSNGVLIATADSAKFSTMTQYLNLEARFDGIIANLCAGDTFTLTIGQAIAGIPVANGTTWTISSGQTFSFSDTTIRNRLPVSCVPAGSGVASGETQAPAKYSGPEFSGLSAKGIMSGSVSRLEGKNLDEISSITIDGKPATFKLDGDKALDLTLPEGLAPGTYDLVINSSAGKLTHINAILVREPLKSFSITSRSVGKISEEQYQEHALISAMQVPELNKARCVVNASSLAMAKAQAQRLCALVKAANPNIETTVVEARSTVKGDAVFARVSYGWTK